MTKQKALYNHINAQAKSIFQLYSNPSHIKIKAYFNCLEMQRYLKGYNFKLHGANVYTFSCSFYYYKDNQKYLRYITYCNIFDYKLN